jgi:predicted nuclease of predicted toxin-antitoxin system
MKSKKQSGANSKQRLEIVQLFLDRNLGKHIIADSLRNAGRIVHLHDDYLPSDAPDEDWIALVGARYWVAITKDKNIKYRIGELQAIKRHSARVFVVKAKDASGKEIAEILIKSLRKIEKFTSSNSPPFVAAINRFGPIRKYDI